MALNYLLDSFPSQDELATEMQTDVKAGVTYTNKIRRAFDNRGLTHVYEEKLNLDELRTLNSNGCLVIILIYFDITHKYQHYVLVIDMTTTEFMFMTLGLLHGGSHKAEQLERMFLFQKNY